MARQSETHASLIQGVSQQSEIARGQANCELQENCFNDVLDGVVSRMGSVHRGVIPQVLYEPFVHKINRGAAERYIVTIESGVLRVMNRDTGTMCSVSGDISAYLGVSEGTTRQAFQAVTVGDTTFILNRLKTVAMGSTASPARPNYGCAYFRAAGYLQTYTLSITHPTAGTFTASYTTPDNSDPANAAYIDTATLAEEFRQALVTTVFPALVSAGVTGFAAVRSGSTIVIQSPAGAGDWDITTTDGAGDTHFKSFKDEVKSVSDLPQKCIPGYLVAVAPNGEVESERYYLVHGGGSNTGRWVERPAPETLRGFDASTMPHLLVNTGLNTFTVSQATWGIRVAGDEDSAPEPSFVGQRIRSINYHAQRLVLGTEYTSVLSRARNAYVFFPDTAQTQLDSAPIDYDISNGSSTLIEYTIAAGGVLQFWGSGQQTYLETNQEGVKESSAEILPLANYEFDGSCPPLPIGQSSIMFGTSGKRWARVTEVLFRNGKPIGEITVTSHVPRYLEGKVRYLAGSDTGRALVLTTGNYKEVYYYQWYNQGDERVLSAWNKWTFLGCNQVIWADIIESTAYLLCQWPDCTTLETIELDSVGDETSELFPLRLDHRVSEVVASYGSGYFTVTLPHEVHESFRQHYVAYERTNTALTRRGRKLQVTWLSADTVRVDSPDPACQFYLGVIPMARFKPTRFRARDRQGQVISHEKLLLDQMIVGHKGSVEFYVKTNKKYDGQELKQTYTGRVLGDGTVVNYEIPFKSGKFRAEINEETENVEIELVNETPYPAIWTDIKYVYDLTVGKA